MSYSYKVSDVPGVHPLKFEVGRFGFVNVETHVYLAGWHLGSNNLKHGLYMICWEGV